MRHQLLKAAIAAFGLMALIGCGENQSSSSTPQESSASQSSRERVDDVSESFAFLRYAVNAGADAPEICLTFSDALAADADYGPYLDIDANIALRVDGTRLCLGGLTYGEVKTLTLRAGLPAADGEKLEKNESLTLTFDDRPPVVSFSGSGVILPRLDADGLAITTVNVAEVEIAVSRVNDRALVFRSLTDGFQSGEGEYSYSYDEPYELGSEVWRGRMTTEGPLNATRTTVFPITEAVGELEAGAYYVELYDASALDRDVRRPAQAARWIVVTDLAFTAYQGTSGLDVTLRSLKSAQPMSGVDVQLVARSNEVLATARTNGNGQVRFDDPLMSGRDGNRPKMLFAYGNSGDFAVLDLDRAPVDLSNEPISGRDRPANADAYMYLDRGVYRPGETVQTSVLLRNDQGRALKDRPGAIVLYQPNGLEQARLRFEDVADAGALAHGFELPDAAARGSWRLEVELDGLGTISRKNFSVEDFVPQRIELRLKDASDSPVVGNMTRVVTSRVRFLYGAPGVGLKIGGSARIQPDPNPFPDFDGFRFGLHDEQFRESQFDLPDTTADNDGMADTPVNTGERGRSSTKPLRIRAVIEAHEPGGRVVADDVFIPYRPAAAYYGLKPNFDGRAERNTEIGFEAIALDPFGRLLATDVKWRLVRKDYDYDWYRTDGGSWRWRRTERVVPIEAGVLALGTEGPVAFSTPSLDWGDYTLYLTADGRDVASTAFWVGWRGRTVNGVEAPDQVRVSGPSEAPGIGQNATISIRAPYAGLAEVVVATDKVLLTRQIDIEEQGAEITLPVSAEWDAGAYVMVTVYTPRDSVIQPRPRRAVGVAYVPVNVSSRTYDVTLDAPTPVEPGQTVTVEVTAENGPRGEKAYVTLAAVDEGILLLTKFDSPAPADWFFGKARMGVRLFDDYGRILDPNQGAAAAIRSGGDQIGGAGLSVVPTKTVALYSGIVELGRGGKARIPLELPNFNGELRLMAVAWSDSGLGSADSRLTVRDDVPLELVLPRFLAPGDTAGATVSADNVAGPEGDYSIRVNAEGPITIDDIALTFPLRQGQREDRSVYLSADDTGIASLSVEARGPGGYTVGSTYPIEVRSAFWPETRIEKFTLAPGESYTPTAELLDGFLDGSGLVQVSAAATPIDTAALYKSLYSYPYMCTEQLVSRVMPLLYADQLATLEGITGAEGNGPEIRQAIETLLSRQNGQGAFGLWRIGDRHASPWLGAYAADFLTRAKEKGHAVPEAAAERALDALTPLARGEFYRSSGYDLSLPPQEFTADTPERLRNRSSAYALYVLARNGKAERSRLRYMHDEQMANIESPLARAHIAAGLALLGDRGRAASGFAQAIDAFGYNNEGDWYQTPRRDLAAITALAAEAGFMDIIEDLAPRLAQDVPEPRRLTTQEKAQMILAAKAIAGEAEAVELTYGDQSALPVRLTKEELAISNTFTNDGDSSVWVTLMASGNPVSAPPAQSNDLTIEKRITLLNGNEVNLENVPQGRRLIVTLNLTPERAAEASYVIADLLPAGFEIEAIVSREEASETGPYSFIGELARPQIAEERDDRFVAALEARGGNTYRLAYIVRAVTPGEFTLPGAVAEDMYRPDVIARSDSGSVIITP